MLLSVREAADHLGLSKERITQLITEGKLPAVKIGFQYAIDERDLKKHEKRKGPGNPNWIALGKKKKRRQMRQASRKKMLTRKPSSN